MKKRGLWLSLFVLGMVLLISACSSSASKEGEGASELGAIKEAGVLRVGATTTGVPFTFLDTKTNQIDGVMVDVAKKVGEHLNVKVEIVQTKFSSLIPSLEADKIDVISAGMLKTEERAKMINFSTPVYNYGEALIVPRDSEGIKTFEDLKGKTVGVQEGTTFLKAMKEQSDIKVQSYKTMADMVVEVQNGRIDAFLADYPVMKHMINGNKSLGVKIVEDYKAQWPGDVSLGITKGADDLTKAINEAIDAMKKNGELEAIIKKWNLQ
ncbi:ABC transporter substrate-binding protein [Aneurinibacillus sp. REN35]|uniref:ABC transporter substrate-binding protein n=1 Tax=Aneurinibacillus sp. REN35 TaxID=3237286 RepID=UPI0035282B0B